MRLVSTRSHVNSCLLQTIIISQSDKVCFKLNFFNKMITGHNSIDVFSGDVMDADLNSNFLACKLDYCLEFTFLQIYVQNFIIGHESWLWSFNEYFQFYSNINWIKFHTKVKRKLRRMAMKKMALLFLYSTIKVITCGKGKFVLTLLSFNFIHQTYMWPKEIYLHFISLCYCKLTDFLFLFHGRFGVMNEWQRQTSFIAF